MLAAMILVENTGHVMVMQFSVADNHRPADEAIIFECEDIAEAINFCNERRMPHVLCFERPINSLN